MGLDQSPMHGARADPVGPRFGPHAPEWGSRGDPVRVGAHERGTAAVAPPGRSSADDWDKRVYGASCLPAPPSRWNREGFRSSGRAWGGRSGRGSAAPATCWRSPDRGPRSPTPAGSVPREQRGLRCEVRVRIRDSAAALASICTPSRRDRLEVLHLKRGRRRVGDRVVDRRDRAAGAGLCRDVDAPAPRAAAVASTPVTVIVSGWSCRRRSRSLAAVHERVEGAEARAAAIASMSARIDWNWSSSIARVCPPRVPFEDREARARRAGSRFRRGRS